VSESSEKTSTKPTSSQGDPVRFPVTDRAIKSPPREQVKPVNHPKIETR